MTAKLLHLALLILHYAVVAAEPFAPQIRAHAIAAYDRAVARLKEKAGA